MAWNRPALLKCEGAYVPRFKLDPAVVRVPVSPGVDPRQAYGDLVGRGVKGAVLEVSPGSHFCTPRTELPLDTCRQWSAS